MNKVVFDAHKDNSTIVNHTIAFKIGDEVLVLVDDSFGGGLLRIEKIGTVVALTKNYVKVKGWFFSKWYPLNRYYVVCRIDK